MSYRAAIDLSEIELQTELDLLRDDTTFQPIDDIEIEDIFSSSEGDYKLFELNVDDPINDENTDNEHIWKSYFDKIAIEQQIYLNQSQNILSEMIESCSNTVSLCTADTANADSGYKRTSSDTSLTSLISPPIVLDVSKVNDAVITTNPCVPSHVISTPPLTPKTTPCTIDENPDKTQTDTFIQPFDVDNISQNRSKTSSISPPPNVVDQHPQNNMDTIDANDYKIELEKLEEELKKVTHAHHQEQQIQSTVKWSTLLHESKELYDEYMETTQKIKRNKQRLIIIQHFSGWKIVWERNKRNKLQLIKLKHDMEHIVLRLINKTVIRYQNKDHKLHLWSNLILRYRHKVVMNRIESNVSWKSCVVDYIIFHFKQTYEAMMNHRNYLKFNCLPLIFDTAELSKQRRSSVIRISIWYKHQKNKRNLLLILRGIHQLCIFRKKHVEYPLTKHILISWINYVKSRKSVIECFTQKINRNRMYRSICYLRHKTRHKLLVKKLICFRNTRQKRIKYLMLLQNRKSNATLCIQSYYRMFYIRSIMNDVKSKLSSINDIFSLNTHTEQINDEYYIEEFKTLDENEYIFDESIIEFDLKPLSDPPSPKVQHNIKPISAVADNKELSECLSSFSAESECDTESLSDAQTESDTEESEGKCEMKDNEKQNAWQFQNQEVAKSWLKRKKKFKAKKKAKRAQSRVNRFNKRKHVAHSFGLTNRFKNNTKRKSTKQKFVKFGCPQT